MGIHLFEIHTFIINVLQYAKWPIVLEYGSFQFSRPFQKILSFFNFAAPAFTLSKQEQEHNKRRARQTQVLTSAVMNNEVYSYLGILDPLSLLSGTFLSHF